MRCWAIVGWFAVGCGFGSSGDTLPARTPDASPDGVIPIGDGAIDGAIDAIDAPAAKSWVVIETLTLASKPALSVETSKMSLTSGVGYRLRASGTYLTRPAQPGQPAIYVDAEYRDFDQPDDAGSVDYGIAVDDVPVDEITKPYWGQYNSLHVYEVDWPGTGQPIRAGIVDGDMAADYNNNVGELTLEILEWK